MTQTLDCPHCKAKHGWFSVNIVTGERWHQPDGTPAGWIGGRETAGEIKFCVRCRYSITNCITVPPPPPPDPPTPT